MIETNRPQAMNAQADVDRTILVPRPGGRQAPVDAVAPDATRIAGSDDGPTAAASTTSDKPSGMSGGAIDMLRRQGSGLNPLVQAANPLLDLVVPLRYLIAHPDVDALRQNLVRAIKDFEVEARAQHVEAQSIAVARYALCTFLDETIANTPSGSGGAWASKSLLVAFHNEAWGGEKFFVILQRLAQEPARHLHLLELMYLCLALGFEGRYRVLDGGRDKLESLRERLQKMIEGQRGIYTKALSLHWQASTGKPESLFNGMPLWIMATAAAALILIVHIGLSITLSHASNPVFEKLKQLHVASMIAAPLAAEKPSLSLANLLAPEISHGLVSLSDEPGEIKITLRGDGVFASGRAEVANIHKPLIDRIGDALKQVDGEVVVIGHTDNVPYASSHFQSNDELSLSRAKTVRALLEQRTGQPQRYKVEGFGSSDPLLANDSAANRARNRRVDIILSTSGNSAHLTIDRTATPPATKETNP